ncbi:MAG: rhodanese-like domain-containing protein [Luteolibacter sp.]|jgi:rhodanese-related sulfurtransferase|nr:rhodanese-like domain-containing protein [Luteolibacter sp.]
MKVQAKQVQQDLQSGKRVALIDVRTPVEHREMHIAGSRLMPLDKLDPDSVKAAAVGNESCVLICRSGKRAEQAYEKLRAAGFENLTILEGGVIDWESAGLPLERSSGKHLPLMRQVQLIIGLLALTGSVLALTVDRNFAILPAILGAGLTMAGSTGWCGLAILLSKMPWNKVECGGRNVKSCSV